MPTRRRFDCGNRICAKCVGMIFPSNRGRIVVATKPVDFGDGLGGFAAVMTGVLHKDKSTGTVFIFRVKRVDNGSLHGPIPTPALQSGPDFAPCGPGPTQLPNITCVAGQQHSTSPKRRKATRFWPTARQCRNGRCVLKGLSARPRVQAPIPAELNPDSRCRTRSYRTWFPFAFYDSTPFHSRS